MLLALHFASLVFWLFVVCGLVYFIRDAWMREPSYKPRTKWNAEYYSPTADPFMLEDK